jgi:hypothetical protein
VKRLAARQKFSSRPLEMLELLRTRFYAFFEDFTQNMAVP